MTLLSDRQIAAAALAGGIPRNTLATAVAIALAESGGRTTASHVNSDGSTDYGLWQINSVHASLLASGRWNDPVGNARMANAISSGGTNWTPWTTYNSGAYRLFLVRGAAAASGASATAAPSGANTIASSGPNKPVVRTWVTKPGFWRSYLNHKIPDPPVPIHYGKPTGNLTTDTSGASVPAYPASKDAAVFAWLVKYWDDGSFAKLYGKSLSANSKMTHTSLSGHLYDVIAHQEQDRWNEKGGVADPGKADPGIGPIDPLGALADLIAFLTNPRNWLRVAYFLIGGALLLAAANHITGGSVGGALGTAVKVAAL